MDAWTIEELQIFLKKYGDPNSGMNYFRTGGPSDELINEARALLKHKLALRGIVEHG